ncbi:MAG: NAD-dependent epimerase/dehydratase family protein [Bacteroidetes bacterium]|jgi:nucleoside-diphosphate-sugar epimerase|nr:NAD-dependent epimerase/dehydratase family protein [Phycisphaerae bacterium]NBB74544.1 NAD-dependent epimerase/dehydratase family protein [Bacteroidota bacterium]
MNLVTGATGLLGSHIVEKLREQGQPVRALVRPTSDTRVLESFGGVEFARGDITDLESLRTACKGVTTVYHSAAAVGDWGSWKNYFVPVTIRGTENMITAAREAGVERFLHVSSISAYGHPNEKGRVIDESAPLGQNLHKWSYYSRAKVEAETMVWAAHEKGDIQATVVKPSWLYGPRDRASLPRIIRALRAGKGKLLGDGQNRMNLTYAGNEADGCILAATKSNAIGENYNLSCDGVITQAEYFNKIAECLHVPPVKKHVPYWLAYNAAFWMEFFGHLVGKKKPPLVTRYSIWLIGRQCFFSEEKARRELGWEATVGYDEGIQRSVKWCLDNVDDLK